MNNKTKILVAVIGIVLIAGAASFFGSEYKTEKNKDIKNSAGVTNNQQQKAVEVRYLATAGSIRLFEIAKELGYNKEFINITYIGTSTGGPESIQTIASGSADIASSALVAIINARDGGYKIKAIIGSGGSTPNIDGERPTPTSWIVLKNSSIKSAKDLAGKRIAVNTLGAASDFATRTYLANNGMSRDQVELVVIPNNLLEQTLKQGQVDVIAGGGTTAEKMIAKGDVRVLVTEYDFLPDQTNTMIFTSDRFLNENPEAAKKLVEALAKTADWVRNNPKESKVIAAKILKDRGENPDNVQYWKGFGLREHALIADSDIQYWIDYLVQDGRLKEGQFKPSNIYTNEFNPHYIK